MMMRVACSVSYTALPCAKTWVARKRAHRHIPLQIVADELLHLIVGANRHGGFDHDEAIARDACCDLAANRRNVAKVCAAVGLLRRTDADEDRVRVGIGALVITREKQPPGGKQIFLSSSSKPAS